MLDKFVCSFAVILTSAIPVFRGAAQTTLPAELPATPAPATSVVFRPLNSVTADPSGNLYFSSYNCVFKVDKEGVLTRVAGNSTVAGYSGDGGPATSAQLNRPEGVAVNAAGNLYIADYGNQVIRKVAANGTITTVAGNGTKGYTGDGGPATKAQLYFPYAVAVDSGGSLYIADRRSSVIRKVDPSGTITTVAGSDDYSSGDKGVATSVGLSSPETIAVDTSGNFYIADPSSAMVRKVSNGMISTVAGQRYKYGYSGDDGPATAAQLGQPNGVAVDAAGNLYIAGSYRMRKVDTKGTITTLAGTGKFGYSGDGGPALSAELGNPHSVAIDAAGNIYFTEEGSRSIRKIDANGIITTIAGRGTRGYSGDGGRATSAEFFQPQSMAMDTDGNLYVADYGNSVIRRVAADGTITTIAGKGAEVTPLSRAPLTLKIHHQSPRVLYETVCKVAGIKVAFDSDFLNMPATNGDLEVVDVSLEQALDELRTLTNTSWEAVSTGVIAVTRR